MTKEKLYRLMDLLDDLKKIDSAILVHSEDTGSSRVMLQQYVARKEQLIVYLINELNASSESEFTPQRLNIIRQIMNRFYKDIPLNVKHDKQLDQLEAALSA